MKFGKYKCKHCEVTGNREKIREHVQNQHKTEWRNNTGITTEADPRDVPLRKHYKLRQKNNE